MRSVALVLLVGCGTPPAPVECPLPEGLPAFPGAEGFGSTTPGGRGGKVIEVTSLDDHGPGTLREALETKGPRLVVFRVAGSIALERQLEVTEPFLTVAGQTAPGDGIELTRAGLVIWAHDVVLQHLRVRPGFNSPVAAQDNDAIQVNGPQENTPGAYNVILDHVSASWGEDEVLQTYFGVHDVTVSWSIVSEGLASLRHPKGAHSAGLLFAGGTRCAAVHHTLLAHNGFRNPLLQGAGRFDVTNNVIYDWHDTGTEVQPLLGLTEVNLVKNVYLPGADTNSGQLPVNTAATHPVNHFIKADQLYGDPLPFKLFADGNVGPGRLEDVGDQFALVAAGYGSERLGERHRSAERFATAPVTVLPLERVETEVLAKAGARPATRDAVDLRVVRQVKERTGRIINSHEDVGGFPQLTIGEAPADGDHDGMPDAWERAHGTDPANAADGALDADADGYTNVEEYLHSL